MGPRLQCHSQLRSYPAISSQSTECTFEWKSSSGNTVLHAPVRRQAAMGSSSVIPSTTRSSTGADHGGSVLSRADTHRPGQHRPAHRFARAGKEPGIAAAEFMQTGNAGEESRSKDHVLPPPAAPPPLRPVPPVGSPGSPRSPTTQCGPLPLAPHSWPTRRRAAGQRAGPTSCKITGGGDHCVTAPLHLIPTYQRASRGEEPPLSHSSVWIDPRFGPSQ